MKLSELTKMFNVVIEQNDSDHTDITKRLTRIESLLTDIADSVHLSDYAKEILDLLKAELQKP